MTALEINAELFATIAFDGDEPVLASIFTELWPGLAPNSFRGAYQVFNRPTFRRDSIANRAERLLGGPCRISS